MGVLSMTDHRVGMFGAVGLVGPLPEGSLFALLAEHGERIVRDEDFAACYSERLGRASIPPSAFGEAVVVGGPLRAVG